MDVGEWWRRVGEYGLRARRRSLEKIWYVTRDCESVRRQLRIPESSDAVTLSLIDGLHHLAIHAGKRRLYDNVVFLVSGALAREWAPRITYERFARSALLSPPIARADAYPLLSAAVGGEPRGGFLAVWP
jgi:hypothetical protein